MTMVIGVKDDENKFDMMVSETINIALDMCLILIFVNMPSIDCHDLLSLSSYRFATALLMTDHGLQFNWLMKKVAYQGLRLCHHSEK